MNAAARFLAAAVALSTMSCAFLETEFEPDAGPVPPPWIVPQSEDPSFESTLQYSSSDSQPVRVTVADVDLTRELQVRFCLREKAEAGYPYLLAVNPKPAEPQPEPKPERTPVYVDCNTPSNCIYPCNRFASNDVTHFLYVIVAAKQDFVSPENGCDVTYPKGYAAAFWRFTCNKPQ